MLNVNIHHTTLEYHSSPFLSCPTDLLSNQIKWYRHIELKQTSLGFKGHMFCFCYFHIFVCILKLLVCLDMS